MVNHRVLCCFIVVLDRDFESQRMFVVLYDRQRPTTGYHFAVLRTTYSGAALTILGGEDDWTDANQLPETYPVVLDIIATTPRDNRNVERRPVSSY